MNIPVDLQTLLTKELNGSESILDIGCGEQSMVLNLGMGKKAIGVDIYEPYVKMHTERGDFKACYCADIREWQGIGSVDCTIMLDVLEHMQKQEGTEVLKKICKWSQKVLVLTPNGYIRNVSADNNTYQEHKSGWSARELRKLGFRVYGFKGLKWLRGEKSEIKWKPKSLFELISAKSRYAVWWIPELAFYLWGVFENK
jgi:hypothetical protein